MKFRRKTTISVLMALVMGAMTAGEAGAMAPDFGEAKLAANRIITLLNLKVCNRSQLLFELIITLRAKYRHLYAQIIPIISFQPGVLSLLSVMAKSSSTLLALSIQLDPISMYSRD